ncbi:hypothetical protein MRX96_002064 [Rhipicephalus microplus]
MSRSKLLRNVIVGKNTVGAARKRKVQDGRARTKAAASSTAASDQERKTAAHAPSEVTDKSAFSSRRSEQALLGVAAKAALATSQNVRPQNGCRSTGTTRSVDEIAVTRCAHRARSMVRYRADNHGLIRTQARRQIAGAINNRIQRTLNRSYQNIATLPTLRRIRNARVAAALHTPSAPTCLGGKQTRWLPDRCTFLMQYGRGVPHMTSSSSSDEQPRYMMSGRTISISAGCAHVMVRSLGASLPTAKTRPHEGRRTHAGRLQHTGGQGAGALPCNVRGHGRAASMRKTSRPLSLAASSADHRSCSITLEEEDLGPVTSSLPRERQLSNTGVRALLETRHETPTRCEQWCRPLN